MKLLSFARPVAALAALASFAATAQAQSSVTVYGRVNTTVESQKSGDERKTVMQNNASRWGLRGIEDLGDGLKAHFRLESGFGSDDGSLTRNELGQFQVSADSPNALFNREAFLGLSGGFGAVRLGRILSPVYLASADYVSMHNHDTGTSSDALFAFQATGLNNNNTLAYETPEFYGTTVEVAHSMNTESANNNRDTTQVAQNFNQGSLHLGAGYAVSNDNRLSPSTKDEMGVLRGLYDFGPFVLGAYYEYAKLDVADVRRARNNVRVSGMYRLDASEFHANVGYAGDLKGLSDSGALQWTLAYNYNLSKRTKVYAFYSEVRDDGAGYYVQDGRTNSYAALGIRHNF